MKQGMDIVGKLPKATGERVFMLAMAYCFYQWIEAESFVQVRENEAISFINVYPNKILDPSEDSV